MSDAGTPQLHLEALIEAVLFVAGDPVPVAQLAEWLEVPLQVVQDALPRLAQQLRGVVSACCSMSNRKLVSAVVAAPVLRRMLGQSGTTKLTNAASEVLTIIAYRQPITRAQIEAIRGVDCSTLVRQLQVRELVVEVGRMDTVGRPVLFGTSEQFLRQFGLTSLTDLPPLEIPTVASEPV
jgi:segregation and condensation protein B